MVQNSNSKSNSNDENIAIIGGGPSGMNLLRSLVHQGFTNIDVYEKRQNIGGLWNYTPYKTILPNCLETTYSTKLPPAVINNNNNNTNQNENTIWDSPMYTKMDTNVPRQNMELTGKPFDDNLPLFPDREDILKYLQSSMKKYTNYVLFNTEVVDIEKCNDKIKNWKISYRKSIPSNCPIFTKKYTYIGIAPGWYDVPFIPKINGINEWCKKYGNKNLANIFSHSRIYRNPQEFKNLKVVVVGSSASGLDLSYQISQFSSLPVYRCTRQIDTITPDPSLGRNKNDKKLIETVGEIDKIIDIGSCEKINILLKDGNLLKDIEKVVFATGYFRSIPFAENGIKLKDGSNLINKDGTRIRGMYLQVIFRDDPTIAIIGLPRLVLPTRLTEVQSAYIARIWWKHSITKFNFKNNNLKMLNNGNETIGSIQNDDKINGIWEWDGILPRWQEMKKEEDKRLEERGDGKSFHDMKYPEDLVYYRDLLNKIVQIDNREKENMGNTLNNGKKTSWFVPQDWTYEEEQMRKYTKELKSGYLQLMREKGIYAKTRSELIESGYLEDEKL